jgi:hypothetical protein
MDIDLERSSPPRRDGHGARDQLAARPARPARRRRRLPASAACGSSSRPTRTRPRARLRDARHRHGRRAWLTKDQIVNTRPWSKVREAAARRTSTLPRGRPPRGRLGRRLPRARRRAAGARAGQAGRHPCAAAAVAAGAAGAVRGGAPRPRRDPAARVTHWQHPRFFAYFAVTAPSPGSSPSCWRRR